MSQITQLRQILQPLLGWHGARISFLALFLVALFRVKTVNLAEVATAFPNRAKAESNYKRMQRFLRWFEVDYDQIARLVMQLMDIPKPWVLSVDRTTWEFGSVTINILMLGVVHQGVAFPVFWQLLDKRGNSNTGERLDLLVEFLCEFAPDDVAYLTADREFIGSEWFALLLAEPLTRFRIRIRETELLWDGQRSLNTAIVFQDLQPHQSKILSSKRRLWGHWLYLVGLRLKDGSLLVVATDHAPATALSDYALRWGIETLFGCFKTRGFRLESTHLKDRDRLKKLIALLTLAFCWAHRVGQWCVEHQPLKIKKHGRKARGCVAKRFSGRKTSWKRSVLCSNSKDLVNERDLSYHISFFNSLNLSLPDHIHCFVSFQCSSRRVERLESHACLRQSFYCSMVLLNNVI